MNKQAYEHTIGLVLMVREGGLSKKAVSKYSDDEYYSDEDNAAALSNIKEYMANAVGLGKGDSVFHTNRLYRPGELWKSLAYLHKIKDRYKGVDNPHKEVVMLFDTKTGDPMGHSWGPVSNLVMEEGYTSKDIAKATRWLLMSNARAKELFPKC